MKSKEPAVLPQMNTLHTSILKYLVTLEVQNEKLKNVEKESQNLKEIKESRYCVIICLDNEISTYCVFAMWTSI